MQYKLSQQQAHLIATPEALTSLAARLIQSPTVAIDTESNSLYAYRERVCLIQFSVFGEDYLVDPLALADLSPLDPVFDAPDIEFIFHAADYDLIVLQRDYGFSCHRIFDTMWAARVLGWDKVGLGNILEIHFNLHPDKRYQRYNWGERPLEAEAIEYARTDTHFLQALRELQLTELRERERLTEAQEIFNYLCHNVPQPAAPDLDQAFWRIKGVRELSHDARKALYALHLWREQTAEALDRPVIKVMGDARLIKLALVQPRTRDGLIAAGLTRTQASRFGKGILAALKTKPPHYPELPNYHDSRPPEHVMDRYRMLRAWRKDIASNRGVDSDVILPNATLWEIAQNPPHTLEDLLPLPGIGPWRQQTYGPDILALLNTML